MYNNFFEKIDTEEKAYWLGFIAADGCVRKDKSCLIIELAERDREHLVKFNHNFDNYYKIVEQKREYNSVLIRIYSRKCCEDLYKYGITPAKSLTLEIDFTLIPDELKRHFIRGYFDGDGSLYCSHPKRKSGYNYEEWGCNFVGTKQVLTFISQYFHITSKPAQKKGYNYYTLDIGGTLSTYEVVKTLYEDCNIYLNRKKELFDTFQSSQRLNKLVSKREYFAEEKDTSILVGLILGGGSIKGSKIITQSKDINKLQKVQKIFEKYRYKILIQEKNICYGKVYQFIVEVSPEIAKHYKHLFYPNGNKTVTRHLLNELNNDAITVWIILNSHFVDSGLALGTLKFTLDENEIIQRYFQVVHKIDTRLRHQREKYYIFFPKASKEYLFNKVYVPMGT